MQILGILNLTRDSFSDGGRYFDPPQAVAHARRMLADGADIIDIGAQSTRPEAEEVTAKEEFARLNPVLDALHSRAGGPGAGLTGAGRPGAVRISIDTFRPAVMRAVLQRGIEFSNDVTALRDPDSVAAIREAVDRGWPGRVILMHSTAVTGARAERVHIPAARIMPRIVAFFEERIAALAAAGIPRDRLILDPGLGLFLGSDPAASLFVLRNLDRLAAFGLPLCVSPTRKSFLGHALARPHVPAPGATHGAAGRPQVRPVADRAAGTLASELWATAQGIEYVRTHDVRPLRDAFTVWHAIADAPRSD